MKKEVVIDTVLSNHRKELENRSGEYSITVDSIESALNLVLTLCD